jgi:ubiquitin C-terminal hydrolase
MDTPTSNVLQGYSKFSIICVGCKEEQSIKIQSFYDLSLDITPKSIHSLNDAIRHFQEKEHIEGYACVRCSVNWRVEKLREMASKAQL